jgi:hypothetical protein
MFFEFCDGRTRKPVIAVRYNVPVIGTHDRLQNFRMHSGIIVTGKATSRLAGILRHKETM